MDKSNRNPRGIDNRSLERAESAAMREALGKIAHPIIPGYRKMLRIKRMCSMVCHVYLAKDANWLKDTAKQVLMPLEGGSGPICRGK